MQRLQHHILYLKSHSVAIDATAVVAAAAAVVVVVFLLLSLLLTLLLSLLLLLILMEIWLALLTLTNMQLWKSSLPKVVPMLLRSSTIVVCRGQFPPSPVWLARPPANSDWAVAHCQDPMVPSLPKSQAFQAIDTRVAHRVDFEQSVTGTCH